jgi:anti-sigma-K factor RskA
MDCKEAENLYEFYILGALDSDGRSLMDSHLETCDACNERLQQDGETMVRLAYAVPQLAVPERVQQALFSRVDADLQPSRRIGVGARLTMLWKGAGHTLATSPGAAAASVLLVGLVFGGLWFDSRMNRVSTENEALRGRLESVSQSLSDLESVNQSLSARLESVVERDTELAQMVAAQQDLAYEALRFNTQSLSLLRGQGQAWKARGMMMVSQSEPRAVLLTLNLPPLPDDKAYQVWLISGGRVYDGGLFRVDSTGFGKAVIIPDVPFSEIEALGITVEPAGGSHGPTGANVLKGDL